MTYKALFVAGVASKQMAGKADGRMISEIVKKLLS